MKRHNAPPPAKKAGKVPKATKPRKPTTQALPPSALCFMRPFNSTAVHIPDADVQPSGLVSSHYTTTSVFSANTGTSVTHSGGWAIYPFPSAAINAIVEVTSGGGILTDLNTAGTAAVLSASVPNRSAFYASSARIRCVGIGARLIYEGTELNRSGKIFGGCLPISNAANSVLSTGTVLSALSPLVGGPTVSLTNLRSSLADLYEVRNPSDKVVEFIWKPSTPPHYQLVSNGYVFTTVSGNSVPSSVFSTSAGSNGAEAGQNALVIIIEGDTTPAAQNYSNAYSLEVVWHWEVVPDDIAAVSFDLSPSTANSAQLDTTFNLLARMPAGRADTASSVGYANSSGFRRMSSVRRQ
jgi:hypothetical protein